MKLVICECKCGGVILVCMISPEGLYILQHLPTHTSLIGASPPPPYTYTPHHTHLTHTPGARLSEITPHPPPALCQQSVSVRCEYVGQE